MQIHEYSKAAIRSESKIEEVKGVGAVSLHAALTSVIAVGEVMDQIKKNVFYNRPYDREMLVGAISAANGALKFLSETVQPNGGFADPAQSLEIHRNLPADRPEGVLLTIGPDSLKGLDPRIFHVITGIITEASELATALQFALEGEKLDLVNVSEEIGDIAWYGFGIFPDASAIPPGQILDTNIGKLMKRFPAKFDGFLAQQENRDLKAERVILEEGVERLNTEHIDNAAIDFFAESMKARMHHAKTVEGKGGWHDISVEELEKCLVAAYESTSPNRLVNIANYAAMITWTKNAGVAPEYYVSGVREVDGNCEIVSDEEANFFSVYRRHPNGESEALSDHPTRAEALASVPSGN